jgi:RNA ligase (TIGR02306 family)
MERKLASIQVISDLAPIHGADKIEVATILGWKCVVKKGEFEVGDLCVYFEIDSILPEIQQFEFLREHKIRVKTVRLRGQISQGLALSFDTLGLVGSFKEGDDVTSFLNVKKYEPAISSPGMCLGSKEQRGGLPWFVPKTDEIRIQSCPSLLNEIKGVRSYASVKLDGTSFSAYYNKNLDIPFGVCSRNLNLGDDGSNVYWRMAKKYNLEEKMASLDKNLVIQGELCGPGIQGNKLGLKDHSLFFFNVIFIEDGIHGGLDEIQEVCGHWLGGLETVPIEDVFTFNYTIEDLLEEAKGIYPITGYPREGLVIRPVQHVPSDRLHMNPLSFKVINNDFLLKEK